MANEKANNIKAGRKYTSTLGANLVTVFPRGKHPQPEGRRFRIPRIRSYSNYQPEFEIVTVHHTNGVVTGNDKYSLVTVRNLSTGNELLLQIRHGFRYEVPVGG